MAKSMVATGSVFIPAVFSAMILMSAHEADGERPPQTFPAVKDEIRSARENHDFVGQQGYRNYEQVGIQ